MSANNPPTNSSSQSTSPVLQAVTRTNTSTIPSQFVLLPPKNKPTPTRNPSTISNNGPIGLALSTGQTANASRNGSVNDSKKKKLQKMPITPSKSRFIFSVDDGEDEIEQDLEREYLEGYNDALRGKLRKKLSKNPMAKVITSPVAEDARNKELSPLSSSAKNIQDLEVNIAQNLLKAEEGLKELEIKENDLEHSTHDISSITNDASQSVNELEDSAAALDSYIKDGENDVEMYPVKDPNEGIANDVLEDPEIDTDSISSMESFTLRERQDAINTTHPFGIRIWKPAIYKKFRSVQKEADLDIHEEETDARAIHNSVYIGNILWTLSFGLIGLSACLVGSLFSVVCFGWSKRSLGYAKIYWDLGFYVLHPFGKVVYLYKDENYLEEDINEGSSINEYRRWINDDHEAGFMFTSHHRNSESRPLLDNSSENTTNINYNAANAASDSSDETEGNTKFRLFGRGKWSIGRICFFLYFYLILQPILMVIASICWLCVFTIPMSKLITVICSQLRQRPLSIFFKSDKNTKISSKDATVLVCTYRASGLHYYKYTVDGTNVIILNLMALVAFVISDFYLLKEILEVDSILTDSNFIFVTCLLSIIPLAYFIGQAVASISAQSSMGLGAVINAFFSTIVEIFLYCVALNQEKGLLVEGSMIGSILGAVLLLPGLSMCAGAIKRKTQRYNPRSAGVSSTMLLFSTVVMFTPTFFHQIFGSYEVTCIPCTDPSSNFSVAEVEPEPLTVSSFMTVVASNVPNFFQAGPYSSCQKCHISQPPLKADKLYLQILKPFAIFSISVLFISYGIALLFTLRTHAALIWQTPTVKEQKATQASSIPNSGSLQQLDKHPRTSALNSPSVLSLNDYTPANNGTVRTSRRVSAANIKSRKPTVQQSSQQMTLQPQHTYESSIAPTDVMSPRIGAEQVGAHEAEDEAGGHDAPNWSKTKSSVILLGATVLYAIIAEILVDCVDEVLKQFPISAKFLGLTVFALVPNSTEFLNAISFAMHGNVALSLEIGSAYVLQVLQLQIPALVAFSIYRLSKVPPASLGDWSLEKNMLSLIFSRWDCIASVISVYIFTYIYAEGKSNYFKGSVLILLYLVVMLGFFFSGEVDPYAFMK